MPISLYHRGCNQLENEMRFATLAFLFDVITVVNAHFELAYPPPGPFNAANEAKPCDN